VGRERDEILKETLTPVAATANLSRMLPDGLVAIVKRDCPTCTLVGPVLADLTARFPGDVAVYSQDGVSKVPDYLTDQEVATLPCAALTAWRAMFVDADLSPGDTVVLQGTGGVSIFGLQFAKAAGMRAIITSSSDAKLERAKALGADVTINYRTTPDWGKAVKAATNGRGADLVLEVGGPSTLAMSMRAVRFAGHIAIIGSVGGVAEGFNATALIGNSARLQGLSVGSRDMFESMCRFIDLSRLKPVVDKVFPMEDAVAAFSAMKAGDQFGKIVLTF